MIDPRVNVIEKRLAGVRRIVAFCSAKGGVGKTLCACLSSLEMSRGGAAVGLLDLDFQAAAAHLFLGLDPHLPAEEEGILPLRTREGISLMTVAAFVNERALPLRGPDVTNAIRELLAVTIWGDLDCLILDMPPGIGEEVLDIVSLVPRLEVLVVSTPSSISVAVVARLLAVLKEMRVKVIGVLANMTRGGDAPAVGALAADSGVPFCGAIPFDPCVEAGVGRPGELIECIAAAHLHRALQAAGLLS